jgi:hypothetical protein
MKPEIAEWEAGSDGLRAAWVGSGELRSSGPTASLSGGVTMGRFKAGLVTASLTVSGRGQEFSDRDFSAHYLSAKTLGLALRRYVNQMISSAQVFNHLRVFSSLKPEHQSQVQPC